MSHNGPYPGQSSSPWPGGDAGEPYREPADPWSSSNDPTADGAGWGGNPTSMHPGASSTSTGYTGTQDPAYGGGYPIPGQYGMQPTGAPPAWAPAPPPPRRKGRNAPIVALVVVLALLACGGLGVAGWLLTRDGDPTAVVTPTPTVTRPTAGNDVDPGPRSSQDARFVTKGECVRNEGTSDNPEMVISPCASGSYEVLARVGGRTTGEADAEAKCAKVKEYTKWYFYDSELDDLDFVLCLRER